ncbi:MULTISPECIES: hypothetical protein [Exiguobacterium]|uniref:hypothetical protein n=1 Tax=Exiguobacterium TaxID=33986 RepID=UPI001BE9CD2A|nr:MULTISPECIES: hypothetical protein [Exiguobacterium]MCT4777140.1 hypothetical protein [Exiguobacterium aquaticum]MCT4789366.1 hypothetical protein [Exiguobacterium mexicanum]
MAKNYIVTTYQSAELFLEEFKSESQKWHNIVRKQREKDEPKLEWTLKNTNLSYRETVKKVGELEIMIFEYYRLVRVAIVHRSASTEEKLVKKYDKLLDYQAQIFSMYDVEAPNRFDEINFDDFLLFSRVIKNIAFSLCEIAKPSNEALAADIDIKKFKKSIKNEKRFDNAIKGEIQTRYGITGQDAELILKLIHSDM